MREIHKITKKMEDVNQEIAQIRETEEKEMKKHMEIMSNKKQEKENILNKIKELLFSEPVEKELNSNSNNLENLITKLTNIS